MAVLGWDLGSPASSTSKTKTIGATASSGFSAGKTAAHTWCWATHGAFGLYTLGLKLKINIGALPLNEPVSLPKNGCPHVIVVIHGAFASPGFIAVNEQWCSGAKQTGFSAEKRLPKRDCG